MKYFVSCKKHGRFGLTFEQSRTLLAVVTNPGQSTRRIAYAAGAYAWPYEITVAQRLRVLKNRGLVESSYRDQAITWSPTEKGINALEEVVKLGVIKP